MWWSAFRLNPTRARLRGPMVVMTGVALADDAKVESIGDEAVFIPDAIEGTLDGAQRNGCGVSAVLADEVMVVLVGRQVVDTGFVAEVYVVDEAELLEFVEGPVHGRTVDAPGRRAHPFVDLGGGEMIVLAIG